MRTLARMAMLTTALLVTATASAQQMATIGKKVPDIKMRSGDQNLRGVIGEGKEEFYLFRELSGRVVVFYFWRSTNTESVELLSKMKELQQQHAENRPLRSHLDIREVQKVVQHNHTDRTEKSAENAADAPAHAGAAKHNGENHVHFDPHAQGRDARADAR